MQNRNIPILGQKPPEAWIVDVEKPFVKMNIPKLCPICIPSGIFSDMEIDSLFLNRNILYLTLHCGMCHFESTHKIEIKIFHKSGDVCNIVKDAFIEYCQNYPKPDWGKMKLSVLDVNPGAGS